MPQKKKEIYSASVRKGKCILSVLQKKKEIYTVCAKEEEGGNGWSICVTEEDCAVVPRASQPVTCAAGRVKDMGSEMVILVLTHLTTLSFQRTLAWRLSWVVRNEWQNTLLLCLSSGLSPDILSWSECQLTDGGTDYIVQPECKPVYLFNVISNSTVI